MATAAETKAAAAKKAAAAEKSTDVATRPSGELAPAALFETTPGEGFDGISSDDLVIPFLRLLQKGSHEVDKDDGAFIKGAEPGMFIDTATQEIFEEVSFIVCHYHRAMVEWRDRDSGGGFIAQHPVGHEDGLEREINKAGKWSGRWRASNETHIQDTRYFFGLRVNMEDQTAVPGVISCSSTQIKKARSWLTRMNSLTAVGKSGQKFKLPIFAAIWSLTSVAESKDEYTWRGLKVEQAGIIENAELAQCAKEAREMYISAASQFVPVGEDGQAVAEENDDLPF